MDATKDDGLDTQTRKKQRLEAADDKPEEEGAKDREENVKQTKMVTRNDLKRVEAKYPGLRRETLDTIMFREDAQKNAGNNERLRKNVDFYLGHIKSRPFGDYYQNIVENWRGDYDRLEEHHGYIQWLFPIRAQGMNDESQPLQYHELEFIKGNKEIQSKILTSFELMLDFYGMQFKDRDVPIFARTEHHQERYSNLKRRKHNFLRITRILKCLGDVNLENYQIAWLKYLAEEIFVHRKLLPLATSLTQYWIHTIKDDAVRNATIDELERIIFEHMNSSDS